MKIEDIPYKIGDTVKFIGRPYGILRPGDKGVVLDLIPGIFSDRPYARVEVDNKKIYTVHYWRFEKADVND